MNHILVLYIIFSDLLIKLEFCLILFLENFLNFYLEFFKDGIINLGNGMYEKLKAVSGYVCNGLFSISKDGFGTRFMFILL